MYTVASIPHGVVAYGSRVKLADVDADTDELIAYEIVFPEEVDAARGQISLSSPIGRALMSKAVGDEVEVQTPERPAHLSDRRAGHVSRAPRADRRLSGASRRQRVAQAARGLLGGDGIGEYARSPTPCRARVRGAGPISQCQWNSGAVAAVECPAVQGDAVGGIVAGPAEPRQRVDEQVGQRLERIVGRRRRSRLRASPGRSRSRRDTRRRRA